MGQRIIVADDEPTIRSVITQVLEEDGHTVRETASGEEALECFRQEPSPIVITDIFMGRMSGLDLLAEIKVVDPDCLVIVITSNASLETATQALRAGAYDYLVKPFHDLDAISAVARRAAEKVELIESNRLLMDRLRRNATELKELNSELREMANRDGLTGLYNHRYFLEALERELARAQRHGRELSLLFIDIDHFKVYNDTHGHPAGDDVLRTLAGLLRGRCRSSTIAARYGGEEFVLLIPETGAEGAQRFAESLRRLVEVHPFPGGEQQPEGRVTLSVGSATFPLDAQDATSLLACADQALYRAKHSGRNTTCHWRAEPVGVGSAARSATGSDPD